MVAAGARCTPFSKWAGKHKNHLNISQDFYYVFFDELAE
jgi:hypothetical protein